MVRCADKEFSQNVFINCPFTKDFEDLLKPLVFTVIRVGLNPRLSFENQNAAKARLEAILELMINSKYSIHDLSLNHAAKAGDEFRMNMPFELGIDYGIIKFDAAGRSQEKQILILEDRPFITKKTISDMAGADFLSHKNDPEELVTEVVIWLANVIKREFAPSLIWDQYNYYKADDYARLTSSGYRPADINKQTIPQSIRSMKKWISNNPL